MRRIAATLCLSLTLVWQGCSTYDPRVLPMKLPEAYANVQRVAGAYVAARAWQPRGRGEGSLWFQHPPGRAAARAGEL